MRISIASTTLFVSLAALGLGLLCLAGCSAQQAYGAGQAWQQNQCHKLTDAQDRSRCLAGTNTSHEDYKRQAEATKNSR